jgi:hypothetical protein
MLATSAVYEGLKGGRDTLVSAKFVEYQPKKKNDGYEYTKPCVP